MYIHTPEYVYQLFNIITRTRLCKFSYIEFQIDEPTFL